MASEQEGGSTPAAAHQPLIASKEGGGRTLVGHLPLELPPETARHPGLTAEHAATLVHVIVDTGLDADFNSGRTVPALDAFRPVVADADGARLIARVCGHLLSWSSLFNRRPPGGSRRRGSRRRSGGGCRRGLRRDRRRFRFWGRRRWELRGSRSLRSRGLSGSQGSGGHYLFGGFFHRDHRGRFLLPRHGCRRDRQLGTHRGGDGRHRDAIGARTVIPRAQIHVHEDPAIPPELGCKARGDGY